ncbi:MAG TPA: class I poly(R)-hydroxyalkanoic acid synthase [Rhodocyclaceae bacterium]|nr:class I poly(R)-hydroxyalkanoic acid synthase [Rhodocyclaceae bacterium]HMV53467.1 class I poly(R)-hydroxyalkanoic acid synthase [Rhodocyclaceae bacterium]HMZ85035.1 class I poly(R)-hydroxyalkanoic acid synthase [Rhodocyclaceae bacterium]HNB79511.1 class I poly(R)-hydroxyalkanoic acid synthase [Rhodocyclaceae bacterium]HNC62815.1 class I poly(R)-hydroxyalkanoic acid synthase [Rhodocyclaceae bacterium]
MSGTTEQQTAAMQEMLKRGQAFANQFFEFLGKQGGMLQSVPVPPAFPQPEAQKFAQLQQQFVERHTQLWSAIMQHKEQGPAPAVAKPEPGDRRFNAPEWSESSYFDFLRQSYLINAQFLSQMAAELPIPDERAKSRVQFLTRQYIDAMAPSNFAATNPEFVKAALESNGASITQGIRNLLGDLEKGRISMTDDTAFEIGRNIAVTEGSVIYENPLMQLIQYAPLTGKVAKRPLLLVPPCINKFYIMDLQPESSLVRFMVEQGNTVFLISWKNAKAPESGYGWDDYLELGPITALNVVREVTGEAKPNALGFCVGGTILSSALAVLRARGEDPVASLTLMTTLLDFADAGELGCLVDEASVATREATIGKGGLLSGRELAQVFSSLRANDLIWQYVVGNYLKGKKPDAFDLLYWNADSTNLPGPFLAYYLRHMYLQNELRLPGKLEMLGAKVDLGKVDVPAYLLATREDHIVPWKSAYLVRQLLGGESTFVLGASGHIAGAINPASRNKRSFWTGDSAAKNGDEWLETAAEQKGSWWLHWAKWLSRFADGEVPARSQLGNAQYRPLEAAPGRYVKEKV